MAKIFVILVLLCLQLLQYAQANRLSGFTAGQRLIDLFRGGARGKSNNKPLTSGKSKRKNYEDDDQDDRDDDEDDYEEERRSSRKKGRSSRKGSNQSGRNKKSGYSLIPWGNGNSNNRDSSSSKKKGLSIRERFEQIAKTGQSAYKEIYRRAKVMKSSAFEGILLKATWPSDVPVPQEMLTDLIKYSIPAFKYTRSESEEDPYYMTLHKIWTKMTERDWRTITKSLYILHCISRDSSAESCRHFATAMRTLSKSRNPKKPDQKYFDIKAISDVDPNSQSYQAFIKSYATYILTRSKTFSGKFDEFKEFLPVSNNAAQQKSNKDPATVQTLSADAVLGDVSSLKKLIVLVKKAQQSILQGLQIRLSKKQVNVITGQVVKTLTQDIKDLWQFYEQLISTYLIEPSSINAVNTENAKEISEILRFYQEHKDQVKDYLLDYSKSFKALKLKLPTVSESAVKTDSVSNRIAELVKISGGQAPRSRKSEEEDDEEEEEEEEEDGENDEDEDESSDNEDTDEADEIEEEDEDDEAVSDEDEEENEEVEEEIEDSSVEEKDDDEGEVGNDGDSVATSSSEKKQVSQKKEEDSDDEDESDEDEDEEEEESTPPEDQEENEEEDSEDTEGDEESESDNNEDEDEEGEEEDSEEGEADTEEGEEADDDDDDDEGEEDEDEDDE